MKKKINKFWEKKCTNNEISSRCASNTVRVTVRWAPVNSFLLVLGCINADFCVQGRIFQRFSSSTFFPLHHSKFLWFFRTFAPFFTEFDAIFAEFQERQQILQIFVKISPNFFRISQNFNDFDRSDVKMTIFHKNLRNIAEIIRNFLAEIVKICPKKCIL